MFSPLQGVAEASHVWGRVNRGVPSWLADDVKWSGEKAPLPPHTELRVLWYEKAKNGAGGWAIPVHACACVCVCVCARYMCVTVPMHMCMRVQVWFLCLHLCARVFACVGTCVCTCVFAHAGVYVYTQALCPGSVTPPPAPSLFSGLPGGAALSIQTQCFLSGRRPAQPESPPKLPYY